MWTQDIENPDGVLFADKPAFRTLIAIHEILRPTWLFKPIAWLLLCIALCMAAWRRRDTAAGAFVLGTCGSAIVFVMTYFLVGVASDYRYAYWATLAGLTGIAALLPRANAPINDTA
jgi:cobalamin biosynthesis protein CobD/CbiB